MRKKILFWIDSGAMNIFGLAKYIQNDMDAEFFAIYDVTDEPKKFFQKQKLVNFQKIWFYHDFIQKKVVDSDLNYLKKFEADNNISLWKLASTERIFLYNEFHKFSTEEIVSILEQECKFFENVIDEVKPDFIIMAKPNFQYSHALMSSHLEGTLGSRLPYSDFTGVYNHNYFIFLFKIHIQNRKNNTKKVIITSIR